MASLNQISYFLKELSPIYSAESGSFFEKNGHYIFNVNGTQYAIKKPQYASIQVNMDYLNAHFNVKNVRYHVESCISKLKKHFNIKSTWVGDIRILEPAYDHFSSDCIIRVTACMLPTDDERIFHNINFHNKLSDIIDD